MYIDRSTGNVLLYDPKDTSSQRSGSGYDKPGSGIGIPFALATGAVATSIYGLHKAHALGPVTGAVIGGTLAGVPGAIAGAGLAGALVRGIKDDVVALQQILHP
jgi:hypothetical protein